MKNIRLISFVLLLINASAFSQTGTVQTIEDFELQSQYTLGMLHLDLSLAENDTSRVLALTNLWVHYYELNVDSALFYLEKHIELVRSYGDRFYEGALNLPKGQLFSYKGLYGKSLECTLLAQKIINDPENQVVKFPNYPDSLTVNQILLIEKSEVLRHLGILSYVIGNYQKSLAYLKESLKGAKGVGFIDDVFYNQMSIAKAYLSLNEVDSALVTIETCLKLRPHLSKYATNWIGGALLQKALIQFKQKDYKKAEATFLNAIDVNLTSQNYGIASSAQNGLAELYLITQHPDKAQYYAFKAVQNAKIFNAQIEIANAYAIISRAYAAKNKTDSAYHYVVSAKALSDSLQKIEKENISSFNAVLLDENLRNKDLAAEKEGYQNRLRMNALLGSTFTLVLISILLFRNGRSRKKAKQKIEKAYSELKSTQSQLIQSEKMASLGELTAGIAHEIQNPLNFVNNFSEVSEELATELKEELEKGEVEEAKEISNEVIENLKKINHHGHRASGIIKGMLEHSRTGDGVKEPTDINTLADEYLRLAYHGLRAKDKSFNADFKTEFDPSIPKINVIPQDIGRVLLNLINNAFYAVNKKATRYSDLKHSEKEESNDYKPEVIVTTKRHENSIEINVKDNGPGIPDDIKDKIFQPFFTTKPTGSGTGLGLSLSYDIVKAHGGKLRLNSEEKRGAEFIITLP